jgi:glycopeptide antibiotics resistance protein
LFWILLLKLGVRFSYMASRRVNVIPFREYFLYGKADLPEIILNVIIFIPLGVYTGALFGRWRLKNKLLLFFLVSFMVESLQFILTIGAFDVTDIITNSLGGIVGLMIFEVMDRWFRDNTQRIINIIFTTGTMCIILLLALLKLNMLPVKYQ